VVKVGGQRKEAPVEGEHARSDDDGPVRDEDDHDLLTFNESAIRLREEIARTEAALREDQAPERAAALSARLSTLTDALDRTTKHAGTSPGEKGFLGYSPPGRSGAEGGE
jgi:hypothetical protein